MQQQHKLGFTVETVVPDLKKATSVTTQPHRRLISFTAKSTNPVQTSLGNSQQKVVASMQSEFGKSGIPTPPPNLKTTKKQHMTVPRRIEGLEDPSATFVKAASHFTSRNMSVATGASHGSSMLPQ